MRLSLLLSAVLATSVYAAPNTTSSPSRSPTASSTGFPTNSLIGSSTKPPTKSPTKSPARLPTKSPAKSPVKSPVKSPTGLPAASATSGPPGFYNWVKLIVDKDNNCRVKFNLTELGVGTSNKIGRYIPASHECLYTEHSKQPHFSTNVRKDVSLDVSFDWVYPDSVLWLNGHPNFDSDKWSYAQYFPHSKKPDCAVWSSPKNPKKYWVDSRCPFNPEEWKKRQPSIALQGWPTPIYEPHGPISTQTPVHAETVHIKDLPANLSKTGPTSNWVGLYRKNKDDKRCLVWFHNVLGNGTDLSVPMGMYNATAGECQGFKNERYRHQALIGQDVYVSLTFEDDPRWGQSKGVLNVFSSKQNTYYFLGVHYGCQAFGQKKKGKGTVYVVKKGCAHEFENSSSIEEWDPKSSS